MSIEEKNQEKITIIEGPSPMFELIPMGWATSIVEGVVPANVALTRLRTFKGVELVERCHRSWRKQDAINLEYRNQEGLATEVPIVAARFSDTEEGQMLLLWVRLSESEFELAFDDDFDDFEDDDTDDDFDDNGFDDFDLPY